MRVPKVVQLRMLLNVGIDLVIGLVPFVGDVADVFWKSRRGTWRSSSATRPGRGPSPGRRLAVCRAVIGAIAAMAALPLIVMYWIVSQIVR